MALLRPSFFGILMILRLMRAKVMSFSFHVSSPSTYHNAGLW